MTHGIKDVFVRVASLHLSCVHPKLMNFEVASRFLKTVVVLLFKVVVPWETNLKVLICRGTRVKVDVIGKEMVICG